VPSSRSPVAAEPRFNHVCISNRSAETPAGFVFCRHRRLPRPAHFPLQSWPLDENIALKDFVNAAGMPDGLSRPYCENRR
jgi:hypothetical protein